MYGVEFNWTDRPFVSFLEEKKEKKSFRSSSRGWKPSILDGDYIDAERRRGVLIGCGAGVGGAGSTGSNPPIKSRRHRSETRHGSMNNADGATATGPSRKSSNNTTTKKKQQQQNKTLPFFFFCFALAVTQKPTDRQTLSDLVANQINWMEHEEAAFSSVISATANGVRLSLASDRWTTTTTTSTTSLVPFRSVERCQLDASGQTTSTTSTTQNV